MNLIILAFNILTGNLATQIYPNNYDDIFEAMVNNEKDIMVFKCTNIKNENVCSENLFAVVKIIKCYTNNCYNDTLELISTRSLNFPTQNDYLIVVRPWTREFDFIELKILPNHYSGALSVNEETKHLYPNRAMEYLQAIEKIEELIKKKYTGKYEFKANNKLLCVGNFINGIPSGNWITYFNNSRNESFKKVEFNLKDRKFHGAYISYKLEKGVHFKNYLIEYNNGIKQKEVEYQKSNENENKYSKIEKEYYYNDLYIDKRVTKIDKNADTIKKLTERSFKNEESEDYFGLIEYNFSLPSFYVNDYYSKDEYSYPDKEGKGFYFNGRLTGPFYEILKDSLKLIKNYNRPDVTSDLFESYYVNGNLEVTGKIVNNKREGLWKVYGENGKVEKELNYKNNRLNGIAKIYRSYETHSCNYQNDILHGVGVKITNEQIEITNYDMGFKEGYEVIIRDRGRTIEIDSIPYINSVNSGIEIKTVYTNSQSLKFDEEIIIKLKNEVPIKKSEQFKYKGMCRSHRKG